MSRSLQHNNQNLLPPGGANGRVGFHSGHHHKSNTLPNSGQISKMAHHNGGGNWVNFMNFIIVLSLDFVGLLGFHKKKEYINVTVFSQLLWFI